MKNNYKQLNKQSIVKNDEETCSRVLLSRNGIGRIVFCEECRVVELEIGAISMRIEANALEAFKLLLVDATARLALHQQEKVAYSAQEGIDCNIH